MTYEEAKRNIIDMKIQNLKVVDMNNSKIAEWLHEPSPEKLNERLEAWLGTLSSYGRVTFIAATNNSEKQNWTNCFRWPVTFTGTSIAGPQDQNFQNPANQPRGYVSATEATLMATVKQMELQMQFQTQINELKAKLDGKDKPHHYERVADKYGPMIMAALGFNFSPEKLDTMMKMYQMQALMNGQPLTQLSQQPQQQQGMAGKTNVQPSPQVQGTPEELKTVNEIITRFNELSYKLDDQKLLRLITELNNDPSLADKAIAAFELMKSNQT